MDIDKRVVEEVERLREAGMEDHMQPLKGLIRLGRRKAMVDQSLARMPQRLEGTTGARKKELERRRDALADEQLMLEASITSATR